MTAQPSRRPVWRRVPWGPALLLALSLSVVAQEDPRLLCEFTAPPVFAFLSWEKKPRLVDGVLRLQIPDGKGGCGYVVQRDLTAFAECTPVLTATVNAGNKAKMLRLALQDADGTEHNYLFAFEGAAPGAASRLVAQDGASLREPGSLGQPGKQPGFDLTQVANVVLVGDWTDAPIDVSVRKVELVEPTPEINTARGKFRQRLSKEAEARRKAEEARLKHKQDLLAGAPHPVDGPEVRHVCAVAPDVLSITLQAGTFVADSMMPYTPQPGDEVVAEPAKEKQYAIKDGKVVEFADKFLYRTVDGKRTRIALVTPDGKCLYRGGAMAGRLLDEEAVDSPAAYAVESAADPAYAKPVTPTEVFRKSKPNASNSYPFPFLHVVSLRLPTPLKEGASYTIRFVGVNTSKETATYVHTPREVRSDAVHAIQTGYRPDDPHKCAYLSIWLGARAGGDAQDGAYTYKTDSFEVIDATGKTVFTGNPALTKAAGAKERLCVHEEKDYLLTAAYRLDFSSFNKPGEYRVLVPGIGTSYPFRIAANIWEKPFKTAMHGILTQRQGIELGPPFSDFKRARAFHPDDGVEFYQLTITHQEGQEAGEGGRPGRGGTMLELAKAGKLERVTGVWGGYQDAGDWDTLGHHLSATWDLLELYELSPAYFGTLRLTLPPEEQTNALPDLLDEALWQMPCFRRLQLPDGGVRGGYGDGWGCRAGETSPMVKAAGVYAPDADTTYTYAGCAAKAARILGAFDKKLAAEYLESARRAWSWAEAKASNLRNPRSMAAVELYAATREPAFHEAFKKSTELTQEPAPRYLDQSGADFTYARLADDLADPALKKRAIAMFAAYADYAIEFSHKNGYEIINGSRTDLPLVNSCSYFSTPGVTRGYNLIRAYVLTQKPAYLAAAVQATNYCLGANPDNLSYCVGLGQKSVNHVLKVDAKVTGQLPGQPVGYIPYGQGDEGGKMCRGCNGWLEKWFLNFQPPKMFPHFYTWPPQECFVDIYTYPMMSECCFNATTVCAAYTWGFLSSRPAGADLR